MADEKSNSGTVKVALTRDIIPKKEGKKTEKNKKIG